MSLPPLVEPASDLTIDEVRRYSRHLIIPDVGMDGQKRLKNAKVLAVGAGGLGSPVLMYLAAVPAEPMDVAGAVGMVLVAVLLGGVGIAGYARRDLRG